jgi:hypothetical protein
MSRRESLVGTAALDRLQPHHGLRKLLQQSATFRHNAERLPDLARISQCRLTGRTNGQRQRVDFIRAMFFPGLPPQYTDNDRYLGNASAADLGTLALRLHNDDLIRLGSAARTTLVVRQVAPSTAFAQSQFLDLSETATCRCCGAIHGAEEP